jgi:NDP-sugar pyrophosphorylase family protein
MEVFSLNHEKNGVVTLRDVDNPSEYGIAKFKDGKLVEIVEKPKTSPPSRLANVGLAMLDSDKFFASIKKHGFSKVLPPPQYLLMEKIPLSYWISRSKRVDIGRAYNILEANKLFIEKYGSRIESIHISKSAKISKNSYISPNSVIEDDVKILGYSSIDGYISKGTVIKDSVIMEGTKIGKKCHIENSVIGKYNLIEDNFKVKAKKAKLYIKNKYIESPFPIGIFTGNHVLIKKKISSLPGKMIFPHKIISRDIREDKLTRAILFDADNTIYDTRSVAKSADMRAMSYFDNKLK